MPARARSALATLLALASVTAASACSAGDDAARTSQPTTSPTTSTAPSSSAASAVRAAPAPGTTSAKPRTKPRAKPRPPNHCAANTAPQKVLVSLAKQHMWMCAKHRTVYDNAITSGMAGQYTETPTGSYVIQGRNTDTVLTLNTGKTYDVRYWIPFDAPLFGFHDSSWQTFPYGSPKYRTDGSHGCIHMPLKAIAFLYRWSANTTTDVRIS